MSEGSYFNFDLIIEQMGEKYRVRVIDSPAGQASSDFNIPFSKLELDNFVLRMGGRRAGVRRVDSSEMEAVKQCGKRLFQAIFTDDVYANFLRSRDAALEEEKGLRVRLRIDAPEFHDYPWEFLYNAHLNQFLALSKDTPVVRYLELPYQVQPLTVQPPLRILVMISSPEDFPKLNVEEEWQRLKDALAPILHRNLVILERLKSPTLSDLQQYLRRGEYHIFHFVGHGKFSEHKQDGMLLLEDENGKGRPVNGQYLGTVLHDHRSLRLVVLNACEGARTSQEDPYAGVAQTLVLQGIPAVIAMQFEIIETAAIIFAQEFYGAVADGFPVDAAVSEARKAIFANGNDVEWGMPVIYMRTPQGVIFEIPKAQRVEVDETESYAKEELEQILDELYKEGLVAFWVEDWDKACDRFQKILQKQPEHKAAIEKLAEAKLQLHLSALYARAIEAKNNENWLEAYTTLEELQRESPDYKDITRTLVLVKQQMQLAELYNEAKQLSDTEAWEAVVNVFAQIKSIDSKYPDKENLLLKAEKNLGTVRQETEIKNLYDRAVREMAFSHWEKAQGLLKQVQDKESGFLETERLLSKVEMEIQQSKEKQKYWNPKVITILVGTLTILMVAVWTIIPSLKNVFVRTPTSIPVATEKTVSGFVRNTPVVPVTGDEDVGLQKHQSIVWVDGSTLVYVPEGEFTMGNDDSDNPTHTVKLDEFWIYSTEVTNTMYANCVAADICIPPSGGNFDSFIRANEPVVNVTWEQAQTYCNWLQARLPTEAEWEKTARGPDGNIYPWGETDPDCTLLNFNNCIGIPSFVTDYPGSNSYYGALDMEGNVFEWVADWYDTQYYKNSALENPTGPQEGEIRSVRGSGFLSGPQDVPSARRSYLSPEEYRADLGFRCVVDDPVAFSPGCEMPPSLVENTLPIPDSTECSSPDAEIVSQFCFKNVQYINIDIPDTNDGYRVVSSINEHEIEDLNCTESKENANDPNEIRVTCGWRPTETTVFVCNTCPILASSEDIECNDGYEFDPESSLCTVIEPLQGNACPQGFEMNSELGCCTSLFGKPISSLIQRSCNSSNIPLEYLSCARKNAGGGSGMVSDCATPQHEEQCWEMGCECVDMWTCFCG